MPIKIQNVTVYDPERRNPILQDITCQLESQQITLLLGKTGAGKTTLIDALSGLSELYEGSIYYDQRSLWNGKRLDRAVQLSFGNVFQYPEQQLFASTVQGELAYSLSPFKIRKQEVQERSLEALSSMGLPAQILVESPLILSEGQKRRVALASTFATRPDWLLLDEPTAGLDPETIQRLVEYLTLWKKKTSGGIVIATHDLDVLLPIADSVIVLQSGRIIATMIPKELCINPSILIEAEIGIPTNIELLMFLNDVGIEIHDAPLSPHRYTEYILQHRSHGNKIETAISPVEGKRRCSREDDATINDTFAQHPHGITYGIVPTLIMPQEAVSSLPNEGFVYTLDPRSKWLFYILVSIGIFIQSNWIGLILGSIITFISIIVAHAPIKGIISTIKSFMVLIVISVLLSGVRFADAPNLLRIGFLYFSMPSALNTFTQLYKILLLMILGLLLTMTTSQVSMKRGLEQFLSILRYLKVPVEAFSLAASLMLHFIPVIMKEATRFSRITRARGKQSTKPNTIRLRDSGAFIIPLTLSVLRLGSELSLAMEARGYTHIDVQRTASYELKFRKIDRWVILSGVIMTIILFVLEYVRR